MFNASFREEREKALRDEGGWKREEVRYEETVECLAVLLGFLVLLFASVSNLFGFLLLPRAHQPNQF